MRANAVAAAWQVTYRLRKAGRRQELQFLINYDFRRANEPVEKFSHRLVFVLQIVFLICS
jgi:hypothetical protein